MKTISLFQEGNDLLSYFGSPEASTLSVIDFATYVALRIYRNHKTGTCRVKHETLAERIRSSVKSVKRSIEKLIGIGAIEKENKYRKGGGKGANEYRINIRFWDKSDVSNDQSSSETTNESSTFQPNKEPDQAGHTDLSDLDQSGHTDLSQKTPSLYCIFSNLNKILDLTAINTYPDLIDFCFPRSSRASFEFDSRRFVVPVEDGSTVCDNGDSFFGGKENLSMEVKPNDGACLALSNLSITANSPEDPSPVPLVPPQRGCQRECPGSHLKINEPMKTPDSYTTDQGFEIYPESGEIESITLTGIGKISAEVKFRSTVDPMARYSAGGSWMSRKELHDQAIDIYNKTKSDTWTAVRFPDRRLYESLDRLWLEMYGDHQTGFARFSTVNESYLAFLSAALLAIATNEWYSKKMNSTLRTLNWLVSKAGRVRDLAISFFDMPVEQQSLLQSKVIDKIESNTTRVYLHPYNGDPIIRLAAQKWMQTLLEIPADDRTSAEVNWLNIYYADLAEKPLLPG